VKAEEVATEKNSRCNIIHRYESNPILTPEDIPYECLRVYNSVVERYADGYIMVLRIDQPHLHFLGLARSEDGIHWQGVVAV
jgi:predicted GH43/DUF377 family glycosyl hydrolase